MLPVPATVAVEVVKAVVIGRAFEAKVAIARGTAAFWNLRRRELRRERIIILDLFFVRVQKRCEVYCFLPSSLHRVGQWIQFLFLFGDVVRYVATNRNNYR